MARDETIGPPDSVAVIGPGGLVAEVVIDALAAAGLAAGGVHLLDNDPDPARRVAFGARRLPVTPLAGFDFTAVQRVLVTDETAGYRPAIQQALDAGCAVVAPASALPPGAVGESARLTLVPDAATLIVIELLRGLAGTADAVDLDVVALEPASAGGETAVAQLARECAEVLNARTPEPAAGAPVRAFNAVLAGGASPEGEVDGVPLRLSRVVVPVFFGYALVVHLRLAEPIDGERLAGALTGNPALRTTGHGETPASARDLIDSDVIQVAPHGAPLDGGRVHRLWVVADNVRQRARAFCEGVAVPL